MACRQVARNRRYIPPKRVLYAGPELSEDLSPRELEGLARRRLVATTGRCPCGAELRMPRAALKPGAVTVIAIEHELDCPAVMPVASAGRGQR